MDNRIEGCGKIRKDKDMKSTNKFINRIGKSLGAWKFQQCRLGLNPLGVAFTDA